MEATDLRIRNIVSMRHSSLIYNDSKSKYFEVRNLSNSYRVEVASLDNEEYHHLTYGDLKPIELTEELLLKCGFEKSNEIDFFANRFHIKNEKSCFVHCKTDLIIKHLHQLQNLYFALTNKELNIEL